MNKLIGNLILLSSLAFGTVSSAKEVKINTDKHKLYIKAGVGALPGNLFSQSPVAPQSRRSYEQKASYHVGLQYFIGKNAALSLAGGYYKGADEYQTPGPAPGNNYFEVSGYVHTYSFTTKYVALEGSLVYLRTAKLPFSVYGSAGLAVTHTTGQAYTQELVLLPPGSGMCGFGDYPQQVDENKLKAHVSLLGIRGGNKIGWYAEAGYGYKGILNAGVSLKLN